MKKILIFLMSAAVAVSCSDDIFDVDPSGKVSSETRDEVAKEDPDKVFQGIEASIYTHYATYYKNDLQWLTGFNGFELAFGMAGQDMTLLLQHSMNLYMYINDYWQEEYTPTFNVWNMFYIPIATANEILATATLDASAESETMKAYRARALTSRAFGYYHLINVYQYPYSAANKDLPGVPLATEETLGQNLPRATMEQVYKRITDDLDEALRIFEEIGYDDTGSRTDFDASVAAILRARVALVMEDWGKAVSLADDILAKYTLVSKENYNNGFNRIENVPSLIFGFKMTADNCQTWATWCSQMDPYMSGYAGMWAERPIHSYLYARLNPTDVRRGWWLNKTDNPDPDAATSGYACLLPSNLPNTLASGVKARSEYVSVKFRSYNGDWNNTDLIYMRAEEAVFIKAEAEAHSNIAAAKKTLKDYVTTYRDPGYDITAASLDDVVEEIILQKRIEMWMEGALEWLDRRRLNMPIDRRDDAAMTAAGVANNHIYKAMWEQNESGMRFQLPRSVVIANPEIGEANQNKTN